MNAGLLNCIHNVKFLITTTIAEAVPETILHYNSSHPDEALLEKAIKQHSFVAKTEAEKKHIIQSYYKFMIYRNPVERLFSAYMSKIRAHPIVGLQDTEPERNWLRLEIFQAVQPGEFLAWVKDGARMPVILSFYDFIQYWIQSPGNRIDEHFTTIFELCSPCKVRYSYYGNFNTFSREVHLFSEKIGGDLSHLLQPDHQNEVPTSKLAVKFYKQLTRSQKRKVIEILAPDLYFYYTLFPAEVNSHKKIMGVNYDIPEM